MFRLCSFASCMFSTSYSIRSSSRVVRFADEAEVLQDDPAQQKLHAYAPPPAPPSTPVSAISLYPEPMHPSTPSFCVTLDTQLLQLSVYFSFLCVIVSILTRNFPDSFSVFALKAAPLAQHGQRQPGQHFLQFYISLQYFYFILTFHFFRRN
jgi:hypothetical protein